MIIFFNFVTKCINDKFMETTNTIRIPNPSKELVAFIAKAQQQKKERMNKMRNKFLEAMAHS